MIEALVPLPEVEVPDRLTIQCLCNYDHEVGILSKLSSATHQMLAPILIKVAIYILYICSVSDKHIMKSFVLTSL